MHVCVRVYVCACLSNRIFSPLSLSAFFQMNSRDEPEKTFKVAMPDNAYSTVYLRDAMSVEEFLASACARRNLNPMEHFVRVKKRRDMEDHNYFVPHRNDLIENYVSRESRLSRGVREEGECVRVCLGVCVCLSVCLCGQSQFRFEL